VKALASIVVTGVVLAGVHVAPAAAQAVEPSDAARQLVAGATQFQQARAARAEAESRYQIGQMERVLEGAVEHGVAIIRDRLQALAQVPADLLLSDNAHARGFRLDGYGVFFDVTVPPFGATLTWTLQTLDQNDLGLESALKALQAAVKKSGDVNLEQAYKRIELQVNPGVLARVAGNAAPVSDARNLTGSAASAPDTPAATATPDPILSDPSEAYRTEVIQALKDAMLEHSSSLAIGPTDWLTIAAKGNDDRPRLAPADSDARTRVIRLRGSDLAAYLARQITKEEALTRIEVRVF
jgi:hypothetical protein